MNKEYPVGDKVLSVEHSMSGKNAFYLGCEQRGCRQNYSVCRHFLKAFEEDRLPETSFSDCRSAYKAGTCQAKAMRQEEIEAGRALYFIERSEPKAQKKEERAIPHKQIDRNSLSYKRGWAMLDRKATIKQKSKTRNSAMQTTEEVSDAQRLVNDLMKDQKKEVETISGKTVKEKSATTVIKPEPGESPLEFARRRKRLLSATV